MVKQLSTRMQTWLADYGRYHQTRGNEICHWIGIPVIVASLLGLLARIPIGPLDAGLLLWGLVSLWYWHLDWRLGAPLALLALGCYLVARFLPWAWLAAAFAAGWVLQFIGHIGFERKSPAFFTNLRHLLIGPLWVFARGLGYIGP